MSYRKYIRVVCEYAALWTQSTQGVCVVLASTSRCGWVTVGAETDHQHFEIDDIEQQGCRGDNREEESPRPTPVLESSEKP